MKISSLEGKATADLNISSANLGTFVPGGSPDDNIKNGDVLVILEETRGYKNQRFNDSIFVIVGIDGSDEEGKQLYLSSLSRSATPYKKDAQQIIVRDSSGQTVTTGGTMIKDWCAATNAEEFFKGNKKRKFKVTLAATIQTRKWDRNLKDWSTTELIDRKIYNFDWV